jgi:penicillin amidase
LSRTRRAVGALVVVALLLLAAGLSTRAALRGSLPLLDGEARVARRRGSIERDALASRRWATAGRGPGHGLLHAQDRFFQMDLMRRKAAGEGGLVGPPRRSWTGASASTVSGVARRALEAATPRGALLGLPSGVNSGAPAAPACAPSTSCFRPPRALKAEDAILVVLAMFVELQDEEGRLVHLASCGTRFRPHSSAS